VRAHIAEWAGTGEVFQGALTVDATFLDDERQSRPDAELSSFERRLVHQLVRSEYPKLITISKRGTIQIIPLDQEREDRFRRERKRDAYRRIEQATGFRWIVEALCGSDLRGIDIGWWTVNPEYGRSTFHDRDELEARMYRIDHRLRGKPRVLVGHNMFLDLVYLYQTFIGALPESVEGFQEAINELFPMIIDTKYLATHNGGSFSSMSTLQQTAQQVEHQPRPIVGM